MRGQTGELLFIFEDEKQSLKRFMKLHPKLAAMCTTKIDIPIFNNDELVEFGKCYANELEYSIDEMAVLALYNRIGKRIVGIGRTADSQGNTQNNTIPDIYEMPRNAVDITLSQRLSKVFELKLSGRDLLAENIDFKQFPTFTTASGTVEHREQVTKSYNPGRSFFLTVVATF